MVNTPELNSVAEQFKRTLITKRRAMLFDTKMWVKRLFQPETNKIVASYDVKFVESKVCGDIFGGLCKDIIFENGDYEDVKEDINSDICISGMIDESYNKLEVQALFGEGIFSLITLYDKPRMQ